MILCDSLLISTSALAAPQNFIHRESFGFGKKRRGELRQLLPGRAEEKRYDQENGIANALLLHRLAAFPFVASSFISAVAFTGVPGAAHDCLGVTARIE